MGNIMGRGVLLVFSAIFAVAFGGGGYWAGLRPLALTGMAAWEVRHWQPLQAQVLNAQLQTHSDGEGGTTYQVRARYRYVMAGQAYEGQRIGLDPSAGADNVGDWQQHWHHTLRQAQERGESVTVWVNPKVPTQALIDPHIRWRLQIFRIPFALVFTGVGVVAAWMFLRVLMLPRDEALGQSGTREDAEPQHSLSKGRWGLWFFTVFWCGIAFPMAALFWTDGNSPGWAKAFVGVFVVIGVGLAYAAAQQSRKAWRYQGLAMTVLPSRPKAGQPVETTLLLPLRAARGAGAEQLTMRVAQYRVDESSSGSPERRVETLNAYTRRQPTGDGDMRLVARFALPDDAPTHGAHRGGERVDWRLELVRADGEMELAYDLPVQAAAIAWAASLPLQDRFDRRALWAQETPITLAEPLDVNGTDELTGLASQPVFLPSGVTLVETPQAWTLAFAQTPWRWSAAIALGLLALEWWGSGRIQPGAVVLPHTGWGVLALLILPAWALHAGTRRWTLQVRDEGLVAHCRSWLWTRRVALPGDASQALVHKLLFTTGSGDSQQAYHAVHGKNAMGHLQRITPSVNGVDAAQALGHAIARAWRDRRGVFVPGRLRSAPMTSSRPAIGGLLLLALLAACALGPRTVRWGDAPLAPRAAGVARVWAPEDARLIDAQNAGDAAALERALRDGANPNLLADNGSSMLMLASHRGQQAHVELLLAAGAQVDLRQTVKDSERGDTALLRAFYGGHLEVAQRLVQAGASLQARNRWDWGPAHMAAQSGCVPCLVWLKERGQSLIEPAPASRGETPAMLAAAKGHVAVLQWLEREGVDLWSRDPHGKNVLDWARFRRQPEAEQWLLQRQPAGS